MFRIFRVVIALMLGGMCTVAQSNGAFRDCTSGAADYKYKGVDFSKLVWLVNGGGSSGAPGEKRSLLFAAPQAVDSGCAIEGEVQIHDATGARLGDPRAFQLNAAVGFYELLTEYTGPVAGDRVIMGGFSAHGTMTGCTAEEARRLMVTETQQTAYASMVVPSNDAFIANGPPFGRRSSTWLAVPQPLRVEALPIVMKSWILSPQPRSQLGTGANC